MSREYANIYTLPTLSLA